MDVLKACIAVAVLLLFVPVAHGQEVTVEGTVTDSTTGEALPGVNVVVKGTTLGAATDAQGIYRLQVPSLQDTLVFSFIGYESAEVPIAGRTEVDVALAPAVLRGEEVVVIGYGTTTQADLTGAVSSVNPEDLERGPTYSVGELLQSKVPGLRAVSSGGEPGGTPSISIRGAGSISAGTGPLFVVDGLPSNVPVNPSDIESIEVLKGPSATAIYGARGANGVILITTKSGREGDLRINYTGEVGMQMPSKRIDVLSAQEYKEVMNELIEAGAAPPDLQVGDLPPNGGTNWQDEIFRSALVQNHDLSFSGGTETTTYYASLGAFFRDGMIKSSSFERYFARMNLDHEVANDLNLGVRLNGMYRRDDYVRQGFGRNQGGGATFSAVQYDPTVPVRNEAGNYVEDDHLTLYNPLKVVYGDNRKAEVYRLYGTAFAEYFFLPFLSATVRLGADLFTRRQDRYRNRLLDVAAAAGGIAAIRENRDRDFLVEGTITYDNSFGVHDLNVLGGISAQKFVHRSFFAEGRGFPADVTGTDNLALADPEFNVINSFKSSHQLLSFIGRMNYALMDRYRLTATVRIDGSSRFGENERFGVFPSVALAWNLDREPFMENVGFVSRLKLRASWGLTGNQAIGNYLALSTFGPGPNVIWDDQQVNTLDPSRLANPNLKWETTEQVNFGLDFGFWDNRLSGSIEYFRKDTYDMLLSLPIPRSTGFSTQLTNIGSIRNSGVELSLSSNNVSTKAFDWTTDLNLATLNNEVQSLGPISEIVTGRAGATSQIAIIKPGLPLYTYYGYDVEGIWQEGENFEEYGAEPGDFHFRDVAGGGPDGNQPDGQITPEDRVPLGDSFPDLTWGIGNTFSYKNLSLYVFVQGSQGVSMLNNLLVTAYRPNSFRRNRLAEPLLNRWTPENPSNIYPSFITTDQEITVSSRTVQDASYARLQTVRLSYEVPFETSLYRSLTLYLVGENLYTLTGYDGYDPAVNPNNNANFRIDYSTYPTPTTYTLGIRLGL